MGPEGAYAFRYPFAAFSRRERPERKGRERRTQRLVSYESDLLCGVVSNCAHILSTYGVCAELNNSPRRRAAHVLDTDEAGVRIYYPALTKL